MSHILEKAEIAILQNCSKACEAALKSAAKEIKKDFKEKVIDQAVLDYYSDYKPSIYKRTESLYNAFKSVSSVNGQEASFKINWNYNWLPQYKSKSPRHQSGSEWVSRYDKGFDPESEDNGIPEKGWVFINFFEGIHPRYYFQKDLGLINDSVYFEPSYIRIKRYKDNYIESNRAKDILTKHLKQQAKKYI